MGRARRIFNAAVASILIGIIPCLFILVNCETSQSLTRKRIRAVEKGLIKAVVFESKKMEKMRLADRMAYYRVPGVSLAVVDKHKIEWAKGYGVQEAGKEHPVTVHSLFQTGALSQSLSSLAALYLVGRGDIVLDGDVNKALRSWKIPQNRLTSQRNVTLRHLLSHSAGLVPLLFKGYAQDDPIPKLIQVLNGEDPADFSPVLVDSLPGSTVRYSEAGYAVVQQLLVDLEQKPFPEILEEVVLSPLRMSHSSFQDPLPDALREEAVSGHDRQGKPLRGKWQRFPVSAAAGLWTTPSDLALVVIDLIETALGRSQTIIPTQLARTMLTPLEGTYSGLGFSVYDEGDNLHFLQRGEREGFASCVVAYPGRGQGAVIMTNSSNGSFLVDEILRAVSEVYGWPHFKPAVKALYRLQPSVYAQYEGLYEVNPDYRLKVTHEDYYLVVQPTGQMPTKFFVESQTTFFSTGPYIHIQFIRDADGRVSGLILRQRGTRLEAKKID
ncbi:MAG: serine hydrolase [Candidatus Aminicenantales bacterium]